MISVARRAAVALFATSVGVALLALTAAGWASVTTPLQASVLTAIVGVVLLILATVGWALTAVAAREVPLQPDETFEFMLDAGTCTRFTVSLEDPFADPSSLTSPNAAEFKVQARGVRGWTSGRPQAISPVATAAPTAGDRSSHVRATFEDGGFRVELDDSVN